MREWADGSKPDLIGRSAMAERLGVGAATIDRWQRRSILPDPDLRFANQDVWLWDTIRDWAKHRSRFRRKRSTIEVPDVVDVGDIAVRLGVDDRTIEQWRRRQFLPDPDYRWENADGWLWSNVQRWARTALSGSHESLRLPEATVRTRRPSGPALSIATPVTPATGHGGAVREVETVAPAPFGNGRDPIGELDRIERYFASMAESFRPAPVPAD